MHTRKRPSRLKAVATVLAFVAGIIVVATLSVSVSLNPLLPTKIDGPVRADSNGQYTAIVDSESRRVLVLNERHDLIGIVNCESINSPIEAVTDVCIANDTLYVAGVNFQKDSDYIVRERVIAYGVDGSSEQIVYDEPVDHNHTPSIKTMDDKDEGILLVTISEDSMVRSTTYASLVYVDRKESYAVEQSPVELVSVYDIGYSSEANIYWYIDEYGILHENGQDNQEAISSEDHLFTTVDAADDGTAYLYDDLEGSIWSLNKTRELLPVVRGTGFSGIHVNNDTLCACNRMENAIILANLDGSNLTQISEAPPSKALSTLVCTVLAWRVYLVLFVVAILGLKLRDLIARQDMRKLGPMFASIAVVSAVTLAIGYIAYGSYKELAKTRATEIEVLADYLTLTAPDMGKEAEAIVDRNILRGDSSTSEAVVDEYVTFSTRVEGLAVAASANGMGIYTNVYGMDEKGVYYFINSSLEHVVGADAGVSHDTQLIEEIFTANRDDTKIHEGNTLRDASQYRLVRIPGSDDKTVAVVEVGSHMRTFEASIASQQIQRIIALLVMILVVYLTYCELSACTECFIAFNKLKHHHDAIAILTRPFSFFVTLLSSIDAVMTTLIARSLVSSTGMGSSGLLLALPTVMLGVGLALGQAIYALSGSRVVIQKLMTNGAILTIVAALVTAGVVWMGNFWLYCAAKLAMAIPFGLLYTLSYSLPRRADTPEIRVLAAGGVKRTDTSAAALGTVLGGYVAQNLGNAWVYVLVALVGIIPLVMAKNLLPTTKHPLEHEAAAVKSRHQAVIKLLTSKTTIPIVLFVMLPAILAAGYNSFMFPLYSANLGLSTSSINNLFVLGQLVVYVYISTLEKWEEKYDKWRVTVAAVALLGVVFLLFSFNTTLVWAVVTIALVGMLCKATDGWKAMWPRSAKANELTTGMSIGVMFAVRSVLLIVQPLLLGALLLVGDNMAIVILGAVCAVCAVAFYVTTRHSALAP